MKPVGIFRAARTEEPGYFATYLERRSIEWQLIALDEGAPVPRDPRRFSGVVFMGGPMSVNDDLPWIPPVLELIRDCVRQDVPVLGHCLGGQLISRAFGGVVSASPVKEIGWGEVRVCDNEIARSWLGELPAFESFHWHGESFTIPPGATRVMENTNCTNQAFALGKHFGMQCHVEMTEALVKTWLDTGADEMIEAALSPGVQTRDEIERNLRDRLSALHEVANRIYDKWTEGLARG